MLAGYAGGDVSEIHKLLQMHMEMATRIVQERIDARAAPATIREPASDLPNGTAATTTTTATPTPASSITPTATITATLDTMALDNRPATALAWPQFERTPLPSTPRHLQQTVSQAATTKLAEPIRAERQPVEPRSARPFARAAMAIMEVDEDDDEEVEFLFERPSTTTNRIAKGKAFGNHTNKKFVPRED
jgi:hypothetical protein